MWTNQSINLRVNNHLLQQMEEPILKISQQVKKNTTWSIFPNWLQPSACKADCLYCWPRGIIFKDSTPGCTEYTSFTSSQRTRPHTELLRQHFALCPSKIAKEQAPLLSSHSQSITDVSASLVNAKKASGALCMWLYVNVWMDVVYNCAFPKQQKHTWVWAHASTHLHTLTSPFTVRSAHRNKNVYIFYPSLKMLIHRSMVWCWLRR